MIEPVKERVLYRSHRPGYPCERPTRDDVEEWVALVQKEGIRSIICLLDEQQLAYYEPLELHAEGLLGFYRESGFDVCSIPIEDRPGRTDHITDHMLISAVNAFDQMEQPVVVHCSAGEDRTRAVTDYILCEMQPDNVQAQALCYLRFFVYREYREIRYLGNPDMGRYDKYSDHYPDLYELDRRSFARLWHDVLRERDPALIVRPFQERTGLTLDDVEEAFRRGEWSPFASTNKNYGGPKHADIALHTLRLRDAIVAGRWTDAVSQELATLKDIEHNRPRPARFDYESLLQDLAALNLTIPDGQCCLTDTA